MQFIRRLVKGRDREGSDGSERVALFVDHERDCVSGQVLLNEDLFKIYTPFYMESEKWMVNVNVNVNDDQAQAQPLANESRSAQRRKRRKCSPRYEDRLSDGDRNAIETLLKDAEHLTLASECLSNNSEAKAKALIVNNVKGNEYGAEAIVANTGPLPVKLGQYIIPGNCSFHCVEVIEGLKALIERLSVNPDNGIVVGNKFLAVIDPAWDGNKSVKRKRVYSTDGRQSILSMCSFLREALELVGSQQMALHSSVDIKVIVWTTNKYKGFVLDQMLPSLDCEIESLFLWHKTTRSGLSAKVRGSEEFLVVAQPIRGAKRLPSERKGVIVSIPSAIHSHKPPISHLMVWEEAQIEKDGPEGGPGAAPDPPPPLRVVGEKELHCNQLPRAFDGLELYARYLRPGFHSMGLECLKLQYHELYDVR